MVVKKLRKLYNLIIHGHNYEVGQVVILNKKLKYFGWINTVTQYIPKYWLVTSINNGSRLKLQITACRIKERQIPKIMQIIWVEHTDVELAPKIIQILYGE